MKRILITLLVLGGIAGGVVWFLKRKGDAPTAVPTYTVAQDRLLRQVSAEGNLRAVEAVHLVVPKAGGEFGPRKIAWLATDGGRVEKDAIVVKFDSSDAEKKMVDGQSDRASAEARLAEERIKGKTAEAARDSAAALAGQELEQTKQFQSKDEEIYSRNQIIESEIDSGLAGAKQQHAEQTKEVERRVTRAKTSLIEVEKQKAALAIAHAQQELSSTEVKAPHQGLFVLERDWRGQLPRIGEQMWPGQTVAQIPLLDTMEVELFVLEVDGDGLAEKQAVEIVVEARPGVTFKGTVKQVEKLAKPRIGEVPVQYFAVVVELEKTDPAIMKPGQRVRARLTLADEQGLVVPRQAVVNKDGSNFVYRRSAKGGFEQVAVELGASTSGRVLVKSGLAAGDKIALRDPTRSLDQTLSDTQEEATGPTQGGGGGK